MERSSTEQFIDNKAMPYSNESIRDTWVFLRGVGSHSGHWGEFLIRFREEYPDEDHILLDLPGNGRRAGETSPLSIRENVVALRRHFQECQGPRRFHFIGTSMGAMVGVEWASLFPEDFLSLTCINTSDGASSWLHHRIQIHRWGPFAELMAGADGGADPTRAWNLARQMWACLRHRFPKDAPRVPMLFLASAEDTVSHPDCTLRICAKWNVEPHIHPRANHDLPRQAPEWTLQKIRNFLERERLRSSLKNPPPAEGAAAENPRNQGAATAAWMEENLP